MLCNNVFSAKHSKKCSRSSIFDYVLTKLTIIQQSTFLLAFSNERNVRRWHMSNWQYHTWGHSLPSPEFALNKGAPYVDPLLFVDSLSRDILARHHVKSSASEQGRQLVNGEVVSPVKHNRWSVQMGPKQVYILGAKLHYRNDSLCVSMICQTVMHLSNLMMFRSIISLHNRRAQIIKDILPKKKRE